MKKVIPKEIIIKDIPKNVNYFLHQKAEAEQKSLNQVIIDCLKSSLESTKKHKKQAGASTPPLRSDEARLEEETAYLDLLDADL